MVNKNICYNTLYNIKLIMNSNCHHCAVNRNIIINYTYTYKYTN